MEVSVGNAKKRDPLKGGETIGSEPPVDFLILLNKNQPNPGAPTKTAMEGSQETVESSAIDLRKGRRWKVR